MGSCDSKSVKQDDYLADLDRLLDEAHTALPKMDSADKMEKNSSPSEHRPTDIPTKGYVKPCTISSTVTAQTSEECVRDSVLISAMDPKTRQPLNEPSFGDVQGPCFTIRISDTDPERVRQRFAKLYPNLCYQKMVIQLLVTHPDENGRVYRYIGRLKT